jgi:hypothetical protein|tara:strand:+ start:2636 stop:3268 length:633 start_codon:yes stop_codon:yes gene_type:complete
MTNWEQSKHIINHHGAVTTEVPKSLMKWLRDGAIKAKKDAVKSNADLIGHIKKEYYYKDILPEFEKFLIKECLSQKNCLNYSNSLKFLSKSAPFYLHNLWVNFQKKHEFNPPHKHSGIYSFVIYLQIPFDLKKEEEIYPSLNDEGNNHTSKFAFVNVNTLGKIFCQCIPVDKSFEGKIILFPAEQIHQVFPFYTSNKYRISVSGNIRLKV